MAGIEPFHVMALIARARELEAQGRSISNMVVGEPDAPTPPLIAEAGIRAIQAGRVGYTQSLGITELRDAISNWYHTRYRVDVPRSRIAVTTGSSGALLSVQPAFRARHGGRSGRRPRGFFDRLPAHRQIGAEALDAENGGSAHCFALEPDRHIDRAR
jgi:hypothetical protein